MTNSMRRLTKSRIVRITLPVESHLELQGSMIKNCRSVGEVDLAVKVNNWLVLSGSCDAIRKLYMQCLL